MISKGKNIYEVKYETLVPIWERVSDFAVLNYYLGIEKINKVIKSPLREDRHPSFMFFKAKNSKNTILYKDFSTGDAGTIIDFFCKLWNISGVEVVNKITKEMCYNTEYEKPVFVKNFELKSKEPSLNTFSFQPLVREWEERDDDYWKDYGIDRKWLRYANVYPISMYYSLINGQVYNIVKTDDLAYTYVEFKEGKVTHKIYRPLRKDRYKWKNSHDTSVISLWEQAIHQKSNKVCICSSLKDALCLWIHTDIPSMAVQGEGYKISETAIKKLKETFKYIYVCFDNDEAGIKDSNKLCSNTGFINIQLPKFEGGKDISDARKIMGKNRFINFINNVFNEKERVI